MLSWLGRLKRDEGGTGCLPHDVRRMMDSRIYAVLVLFKVLSSCQLLWPSVIVIVKMLKSNNCPTTKRVDALSFKRNAWHQPLLYLWKWRKFPGCTQHPRQSHPESRWAVGVPDRQECLQSVEIRKEEIRLLVVLKGRRNKDQHESGSK